MNGVGIGQAGLMPFGLWEPETPQQRIRRIANARKLDAQTMDLSLTDGNFDAMTPNAQRVLIAVKGSELTSVDFVDDQFQTKATQIITSALQFMVDDGSIELEGVAFDGTQVIVSYTDLDTGESTTSHF